MEPVYIEGTKRTPFVSLDPSGKFKIRGRSIQENPSGFFEPLITWIRSYIGSYPDTITLDIELEYFNSGSSRYILDILDLLRKEIPQGELTINWYFEYGDDDLLERGQYYESILNVKFNFIEF